MMWLALAMAMDARELPEGTTEAVEGPAVVLSPSRFRRYVVDGRALPACLEREQRAIAALIDAQGRVVRMRSIVLEELDHTDDDEARLLATVRELGEERDKWERRARRRGKAAVVLGGIVAGVVVGGATALAL